MSEQPAPPDSAAAPADSEPDAPAAVPAETASDTADIEPSAADIEPSQTPVGFIAGMALAAVCAFAAVGFDAVQSVADGDGPAPFAIALPLALLPVPLLILAVLWLDRLEPEPRQNLAFAFAWGAGIAALSALILNTADVDYLATPALGTSAGQYAAATFGAPVVEETMKGLVLFGLLWRRRGDLDGPTDGVIYAAMVGLGFAMVENIGYYIGALDAPVRGGIALLGCTFVLRGLLSPLLHPLFTSMTGLGVAYAASAPRGSRRARLAALLGWLAAVALHITWNDLSQRGAAGLIGGYLIMSSASGGLAWILVRDRRRMLARIKAAWAAAATRDHTHDQPRKPALERTVAPPPPAG